MTSQTQGKGKKKNKETMKVSLDEFNQIDAPHGHSVVNIKMTGLDWAETMADYDMQSAETQQIIVPAAPRAQRGPAIDFDSLPNEPPFRASLYNLPIVQEKEIAERFFAGLDVKKVEITKQDTYVEFGSKNDLYEALCKDGSSIKNRTVNITLYGQGPPTNDRYGGRGSNKSFGDRYGGERGGERSGYTGSRSAEGGRYGDRFNDRNNSRDNNRGGSRFTSGGGEPASSEPENWRAAPREGFVDRFNNKNSSRGNFRSRFTPGGMGPGAGTGGGEPASSEPENWRSAQPRGGFVDRFNDRTSPRGNFRNRFTSGEPAASDSENWRAAPRPSIQK